MGAWNATCNDVSIRADYEKGLRDEAGIKRPADEGVFQRERIKQEMVTGTLTEKGSTERTTDKKAGKARKRRALDL
eukprot:1590839-Amphidinium_carterae.1